MARIKYNAISLTLASILILMVGSMLPTMAPVSAQNGQEQIVVTVNGVNFRQGESIQLTISARNPTNLPLTNTALKSTYATLEGPCGIGYMDFAFIKGSYPGLATYDDVEALKDSGLNVRYDSPYSGYSCPFGSFQRATAATIAPNDVNATITYVTKDDRTINWNQRLVDKLTIDKYYDKTETIQQIASDIFREYKVSHPLDIGTYTIIAFTQSGTISKPVVIGIVPVSGNTTTTTVNLSSGISSVSTSAMSFFGGLAGSSGGALTLLSAAIGGVFLGINLLRGKRWRVFLVAVLALSVIASTTAIAYIPTAYAATYSISSQGMEGPTLFTQSTVEGQLKGIKFQALGDTSKGMSTQNNQFIRPIGIGNDYLWAQSFVQAYAPSDATSGTYTCTLQDGSSYSCNYYSKITVAGTVNWWTGADFFGSCPTNFEKQPNGACARILMGNYQTFTYGSSGYRRIDFNTYQEIQSGGWVYLDQKVRQCTSSGSCTSYTTLPTTYPRSFQYALTTSKYDITAWNGNYYYGLEGEVGFCCVYRVYYQTGTYINQWYQVNLSPGSTNAVYRPSGVTVWPAEQNANFCWWSSIAKSGSTTTTFTASAKYSTSCSS